MLKVTSKGIDCCQPDRTRGMTMSRVEVYWNLHKKTYSVRDLSGPNKGRVTSHSDSITIKDVTFVVQPAGRARVMRDRVKNVHAFVRGVPHDRTDEEINARMVDQATGRGSWTRVSYNPYKAGSFLSSDGDPISRADLVLCETSEIDGKSQLFAWNVT